MDCMTIEQKMDILKNTETVTITGKFPYRKFYYQEWETESGQEMYVSDIWDENEIYLRPLDHYGNPDEDVTKDVCVTINDIKF